MEKHAQFETERAQRHMSALCHHFGRKVPVHLGESTGRIELPFGECILSADAARLWLEVTAETAEELERAVKVISDHLERFAFREAPELDWHPASPALDAT
ncbi:DUF2218 domain-containing protein [Tropicimonas sp. TH_r6]|uniref:DUF2218 domain-containing protein n=1 Tax=Tropicimonas sp. TH_r6 TaxID=3082085 RepID=UPI002954D7AB|nr:DUF2218 domain-containing protein [Tropicimonas sp. TH_r6]MDV7141566.1 DUF2218 domain-containing protein [Tropicimonas sp. TH_r6]